MDNDIANKYFSKLEKRIILIFYSNPKIDYTTRSIYNRMKGEYIYQYISLTLTNLSSLGILKKIIDPRDKRHISYIFSDEYKELGRKIAEEEERNRFLEEVKKESEHE